MYKGKTQLTQNNLIIREPVSPEVIKGIIGGFVVVTVVWGVIWMVTKLGG